VVSNAKRITGQSDGDIAAKHRVGYHDCDFNGHLNNVVAARWLLDAAFRGLDAGAVSNNRLRLTYHKEALRGTEIQIHATTDACFHLVSELEAALVSLCLA